MTHNSPGFSISNAISDCMDLPFLNRNEFFYRQCGKIGFRAICCPGKSF